MKLLLLKSFQVKIDTSSIRVSSNPVIRGNVSVEFYDYSFYICVIVAVLLIILGIILFRHYAPKKTKPDF